MIPKRFLACLTTVMLMMNAVNAGINIGYAQNLVCCTVKTRVCICGMCEKYDAKQNEVLNVMGEVVQTEVCNFATQLLSQGNASVIMSGAENEIVRQVNMERARYGLSPLAVSAELNRAARIRAEEIVRKFSHTRPDGSSWSTVSRSAFGENIAKGHSTANRVMAAWMTSEGHRKNILRASFGSIGVCALKVNGILYWVQLFGR